MNCIRALLAASLLALVAPAAAAENRATPPDATLDALVASAVAKSPDLAAARASVEAARRRIEPSRTLADPLLSTTLQNDGRTPSLGSAEGSFVGVMLSQALPWPGKLALAEKAAESQAREIELATTTRAALTIESRVRNAWYDLLLAHAVDRLIDQRRDTARQIEESVRDRYAAGLAAQQDVVRAQVELARLDEATAAQQALIDSRAAELNALAGRTIDASSAALPSIAPLPADVIASVLQRSPELAAAKQSIETNRIRVDAARKNFYPDLVVSAGSMYRGRFEMGPMWQVGAGISLPIWSERRQQNQLAEALAGVGEQSAQSDVIARDLEVRTRERIAQLEASDKIAALYRDKIVPLDELGLESALAGYRAAKVPFVSVLDAVNALYGDRASYLSRLAESAKWRVAIDEASLQMESRSQKAESRNGSAESAMTSMR